MELSTASFSYPKHDGETRARVARLVANANVDKGFILSTCLRVELAVPGPETRLREILGSLFGDDPDELTPDIRVGHAAATHLYRIAAGLESPVLGEQEILTQFRQRLIEAEEAGQVEGLFARLLESAVSVGRQAREALPISPHDSMAAVAAQAIGTSERVAVLGSGVVATAVVEALLALPAPPQVTVLARHPEKVDPLPELEILPLEHASRVISEIPAVVSATSAKHRLLDEARLSHTVSGRRTRLLLIDMAMPPDFRPAADDPINYIAIDDLARMADRRPRTDEADSLVESAAADAYRQFRDHHELGPVIGGIMTTADSIVESTVQRFAGRLNDPADQEILRQSAHTVARTLLAGPVSYMKSEDRASQAIDVIAEAFGVTDD